MSYLCHMHKFSNIYTLQAVESQKKSIITVDFSHEEKKRDKYKASKMNYIGIAYALSCTLKVTKAIKS